MDRRLEALEPVVSGLDEARRRQSQVEGELQGAVEALAEADAEAGALPVARDDALTRLESARVVAERRDECRRLLEEATRRREAAEALPEARASVDQADALARAAHQQSNDARTRHLDLLERRLVGMAAELAAALVDGAPCQVCGSRQHPTPAAASPDAVTEEQQRQADEGAELAREAHEKAQHSLGEVRRRLGLLEQASGGLNTAAARRSEDAARGELEQARDAEEQVVGLTSQLADLDGRIRDAAVQQTTVRKRHDQLREELAGLERLITETALQVSAVLGEDLNREEVVAKAGQELSQVQGAARALTALEDAEVHHASCRDRADRAAVVARFGDVDRAAAAVLGDDDVALIEGLLAQRSEARSRAQGVLEEADVQALADVGVPHGEADLVRARTETEQAGKALQDAVSARDRARETAASLAALDDQVAAALAAWLPARTEHELEESMSSLVRVEVPTTRCKSACPPTSSPPGWTRCWTPPTSGCSRCVTCATPSTAPPGPAQAGGRARHRGPRRLDR